VNLSAASCIASFKEFFQVIIIGIIIIIIIVVIAQFPSC
jgi:hypothetical protein